jgi:hypothetical protein
MHATCPTLDFVTIIIFGEEDKSMSVPVLNVLNVVYYTFTLYLNFLVVFLERDLFIYIMNFSFCNLFFKTPPYLQIES